VTASTLVASALQAAGGFIPISRSFFMTVLNKITLLLLIVGGLNWGLVGLFGFDLVAAIFGEMSLLSRIVYALVGASALWQLVPLVGGQQALARGAAR
jgi:uncharacterized protein